MNRERDELDCMLSSLYNTAPKVLAKDIADSVVAIRKAISEHYSPAVESRDVTDECRAEYHVIAGRGAVFLYHGNTVVYRFGVTGSGYNAKYSLVTMPVGFKVLKERNKSE